MLQGKFMCTYIVIIAKDQTNTKAGIILLSNGCNTIACSHPSFIIIEKPYTHDTDYYHGTLEILFVTLSYDII